MISVLLKGDLKMGNERNRHFAIVLAWIGGFFGLHHFYLGNNGAGILSILMCWTFLPLCVSLINGVSLLCMTGKEFDRKYNF